MTTVQPDPDNPRRRPQISNTTVIRHPDAAGMRLEEGGRPGTYWLNLTDGIDVYFSLGGLSAEADAAAMDRLAELATEAAAKLRAPRPAEQSAGGA
ncbi:hypothetical protein ACLQ2R_03365 [Streptosporangium sp. DT93]|uniref:hypothetical protein n=1 Tax=Streptosporangium sp. DT93 TaxID=3393428 RepID=UPI003CF23FA3